MPNNKKKWTMRVINDAFRGYKTRFNKIHFYVYANDEI